MNKSVQLCFEILGRHFPEQSNRVAEACKLFGIDTGSTMLASQWKKCACDWLAKNLSVKTPRKTSVKKSR